MRAADFAELVVRIESADAVRGDVVVAGPGGLYDIVTVRAHHGDLVIGITKRPVPVTRRPRKRKRTAA